MIKLEKIYSRVVKELEPSLVNLDFERISLHNKGYLSYKEDPVYHFCHAEKKRILMSVDFMLNHGLGSKTRFRYWDIYSY